ncbi:type II toxin-antitoxin system ParD family antitoxin [Nitratireductor sp. XY-223]|uniref:type II toxin-antitoxin system ParD family antitoxin n=1 Tax=Nitratireductor sp. XY-223 TaxID=2561926 RepID=UPI0010AAC555|nr:type II toxin-antitoxin system ParD family antitoxin [Nitratireductor sp. XY-223]
MANTSMTLGSHWESFIRSEVKSGRYASASEVVRAGLRELEERGKKLEALRDQLAVGHGQVLRGEYVEDFSAASVIEGAKKRAAKHS